MTAAERVQALAGAMPGGSVISFPAEFMAELATELQVPATRPARPAPDIPLKVVEAAQLLGKAPSTIRGWLNEGRLPGAFKLNGKEWRIPMAAIVEMMKAPVPAIDSAAATGADGDLAEWRRHVRSA